MYKMYNAQCDDESDDDKSSLNSSFWSDGERREEEEEEEEKVVIERVISEEDSKPVAGAEDSLQEASEEEKVEIERAIGEEDSKPVAQAEDSHQEFSEEEEEKVETEPVISEEDSKTADDVDDSHQEFSEEEEEESERVKSEEDSKSVNDEEDSEEEVKVERVIDEEDSETVADSEGSLQESSGEEEPELNSQDNVSRESSEGGRDDDDDNEEEEEEDEEEEGSSSCDSPAPSLMTSGYGTYRPEEQEGGDYRDDHTVTEFDQDSRGDLSEMRDDEEDDRSLCSFGGFDIEPTELDYSDTRPPSVLAAPEPEANVACCGDELDITDMKPEEDKDQADEEKFEDLRAASENEVTNTTSEEQNQVEDKSVMDGKHLESREEENNVEKEDKVESEDPDESSSNKDIKFIDSKVDFSQMTFDEMCEEWEGNLRQKKDAASCLEEQLAELHLSTAAQHDFETENEDVTSHSDTQSSETEGVSMSAFESYLRGMTRAHSDGDVRPKPKSFIRPVRHQPTVKKTDPVAKYFQYKQLWEMFKLPGETDRKAIRLEIKERLAYQPPPPKPRRVYVPNTYIVPTEKKRSALRWEIRNDLANGLLPYKFSYRF